MKNMNGGWTWRKVNGLPLFVIAIVLLVSGYVEEADTKVEPIELRMSVTASESSTWMQGALRFATMVKEKTNGHVVIKIYPNEQLSNGNRAEGIELLRNGKIDISFHSNISYSILDERFAVISFPWLFPDDMAVDKTLEGKGGKLINALLDKQGIVGLGFGENGWRQLTNDVRPVNCVEDMKGLKIRISGMKLYTDVYKAFGTEPTLMNFEEVPKALQKGLIDGQENSLELIHSSGLSKIQKYLTIWNCSYDALILGINKNTFDDLPRAYQNAIREAGKEACKYQKELNRSNVAEQLKNFEKGPMIVNEISPKNRLEFQKAVQPVYEMYMPMITEKWMDTFMKNE